MGLVVSDCTMLICILAGLSFCNGSPSQTNHVSTIGLCPCNQSDISLLIRLEIPTMAAIFKRAEDLSKELAIDRREVSARHRQKTSAPDPRLSSKSMGAVGAVVILSVVGLVVVMDVMTLRGQRSKGKGNNKSKNRKSSNTSSSCSLKTTTTSASLATVRRWSSNTSSVVNCSQIGINDFSLSNENNHNGLFNLLPAISATGNHSQLNIESSKSINRSRSFATTDNIIACYHVASSPRHLRSHSFCCVGKSPENDSRRSPHFCKGNKNDNSHCVNAKTNGNSRRSSDSVTGNKKDNAVVTEASGDIPDIIVTCGEGYRNT